MLENSFLGIHKKEITGRAVLESVTSKGWKRKGGTAFISFSLIFGSVGRDCEVSDDLCISRRYNVMVCKSNFQCRLVLKT